MRKTRDLFKKIRDTKGTFQAIRSDQSLSRVWLFATPWITARQASLSITNSWSSRRFTSIESVMPSSHLILCRPLLLLPPIPPSIRVFSNRSTLRMTWPKYWSFSFSIIPSKEMGTIKDRNDMDLTEGENIKRWQEYTEELYRKDLHDSDNHDGVMTQLEPDILKCVVKLAWGSITTNKASGGDGIPVELFQILKDDAMKVLHSFCQQISKTQQWPLDWKSSVFIPIPKKGNTKECSNYRTIALISHASKVMLKILQVRLQQYMNQDLSDVQAGFRKGRRTRDQIANIHWIIEKAREFQKNIYFCFIWLQGDPASQS